MEKFTACTLDQNLG